MIFRKRLRNCLMEWILVSERLLHARFKGTQVNMSILQCYAPTNNAEDEEKENFYSSLQADVGSDHHLVSAHFKLKLKELEH